MSMKIKGTEGIEFPDSTVQDTVGGAGSTTKTRFSAYKSVTSSGKAVGATVVYDTISWQTGTGYDLSTGKFTAPENGYFLFVATCELTVTSGLSAPNLQGVINKSGTPSYITGQQSAPVSTTSAHIISLCSVVKLNAGDTFEVLANADAGSGFAHVGSATATRFAGHLLSNF